MFSRNVCTFNRYILQKPKSDSDVIDNLREIMKTATRVLLVFTYSWPFLHIFIRLPSDLMIFSMFAKYYKKV